MATKAPASKPAASAATAAAEEERDEARSLTELIRPATGSAIVLLLALLVKSYLSQPGTDIGATPAVQFTVPRVAWEDGPDFLASVRAPLLSSLY